MNADGVHCYECAPTYVLSAAADACETCPAPLVPNMAQTACVVENCATMSTDGWHCAVCNSDAIKDPAGTSCVDCPDGYQPSADQAVCEAVCSAG